MIKGPDLVLYYSPRSDSYLFGGIGDDCEGFEQMVARNQFGGYSNLVLRRSIRLRPSSERGTRPLRIHSRASFGYSRSDNQYFSPPVPCSFAVFKICTLGRCITCGSRCCFVGNKMAAKKAGEDAQVGFQMSKTASEDETGSDLGICNWLG